MQRILVIPDCCDQFLLHVIPLDPGSPFKSLSYGKSPLYAFGQNETPKTALKTDFFPVSYRQAAYNADFPYETRFIIPTFVIQYPGSAVRFAEIISNFASLSNQHTY